MNVEPFLTLILRLSVQLHQLVMFVLRKDVAHWLATHVCLVSRLRMTGAILHHPPYAFMACTRTTAPVMTTSTKKNSDDDIPVLNKTVAVAYTFPFPLHINNLHEFYVLLTVHLDTSV